MESLTNDQKYAILGLARASLRSAVGLDSDLQIPPEEVFAIPAGAFVTLKQANQGSLRGCIGVIEAQLPLGAVVREMTKRAALFDPRFAPVSAEEVENLEIEVSIMTPPDDIRPENIEIGRHGLIVQRGSKRGLLLPQVATDHHLTRERFLGATCLKAGLDQEAWREPSTQILGFEATVFSESDTA